MLSDNRAFRIVPCTLNSESLFAIQLADSKSGLCFAYAYPTAAMALTVANRLSNSLGAIAANFNSRNPISRVSPASERALA